jgi:hypothetical protein
MKSILTYVSPLNAPVSTGLGAFGSNNFLFSQTSVKASKISKDKLVKYVFSLVLYGNSQSKSTPSASISFIQNIIHFLKVSRFSGYWAITVKPYPAPAPPSDRSIFVLFSLA